MTARYSDPWTSHAAAEAIRDRLSERRAQVLEVVFDHSGRTSGEYARLFAEKYRQFPIRVAVETPHKRLPELEELGLVDKSEVKRCHDSGMLAVTWVITESGRYFIRERRGETK